jgi:hypothetical protein
MREKKPKRDGVQWHADAKDFRSFSFFVNRSKKRLERREYK